MICCVYWLVNQLKCAMFNNESMRTLFHDCSLCIFCIIRHLTYVYPIIILFQIISVAIVAFYLKILLGKIFGSLFLLISELFFTFPSEICVSSMELHENSKKSFPMFLVCCVRTV